MHGSYTWVRVSVTHENNSFLFNTDDSNFRATIIDVMLLGTR